MGEHHALRVPGGPAGVDDAREICAHDIDVRRKRIPIVTGHVVEIENRDPGVDSGALPALCFNIVPPQRQLGLRRTNHVRELFSPELRIDRYRHRSRAQDAEVSDRPCGAILAAQQDTVAFLNPQGMETPRAAGRSLAPFDERRAGESLVGEETQRHRVVVSLRHFVHEVEKCVVAP